MKWSRASKNVVWLKNTPYQAEIIFFSILLISTYNFAYEMCPMELDVLVVRK